MQKSGVTADSSVSYLPALEELESLDAPGWGETFWGGVAVGLGVGVLIWT